MVLGFLSAGLSLMSGLSGLFSSSSQADAAKAAARTANIAATQQRKINDMAASLQYDSAETSYKYSSQGFDLTRSGIKIQNDSIIEQQRSDLLDIYLNRDETTRQLDVYIKDAENNNRFEAAQAIAAKKTGEQNAADFVKQGTDIVAARKAQAAASGVQAEGSPLQVTDSMMQEIEIGSARLKFSGEQDMWSHYKTIFDTNQAIQEAKVEKKIATTVADINAESTKKATDISLKASMLDWKAQDISQNAALATLGQAKQTEIIQKATNKISQTSTTQANNIQAKSASSSATWSGIGSALGGVTNALNTDWGKTLATKGIAGVFH